MMWRLRGEFSRQIERLMLMGGSQGPPQSFTAVL